MVFLENLKSELEALRPIISELHDVYDIERSQERIAELHEKAAEPNFGRHGEITEGFAGNKKS